MFFPGQSCAENAEGYLPLEKGREKTGQLSDGGAAAGFRQKAEGSRLQMVHGGAAIWGAV